jgi:hypothetical protein
MKKQKQKKEIRAKKQAQKKRTKLNKQQGTNFKQKGVAARAKKKSANIRKLFVQLVREVFRKPVAMKTVSKKTARVAAMKPAGTAAKAVRMPAAAATATKARSWGVKKIAAVAGAFAVAAAMITTLVFGPMGEKQEVNAGPLPEKNVATQQKAQLQAAGDELMSKLVKMEVQPKPKNIFTEPQPMAVVPSLPSSRSPDASAYAAEVKGNVKKEHKAKSRSTAKATRQAAAPATAQANSKASLPKVFQEQKLMKNKGAFDGTSIAISALGSGAQRNIATAAANVDQATDARERSARLLVFCDVASRALLSRGFDNAAWNVLNGGLKHAYKNGLLGTKNAVNLIVRLADLNKDLGDYKAAVDVAADAEEQAILSKEIDARALRSIATRTGRIKDYCVKKMPDMKLAYNLN